MAQTKESYLKGRSTHYLIGMLRKFDLECSCGCGEPNIKELLHDANSKQTFFYSREEIKEALAARPHVSNKKERKAKKARKANLLYLTNKKERKTLRKKKLCIRCNKTNCTCL